MGAYYFVDRNNRQQGPVDAGELVKHGVRHDTMVWRSGMGDWQQAGSVSELSDIFQPQPKTSKIEMLETRMAQGQLFTFANPYLEYIGKGKLYSLVYYFMAIVNLIIPFVILYQVIDQKPFQQQEAKYVFAFIFMWLVIVFACWIGFLLWWDRRKKVTAVSSAEFIAIPVFSDILQTFGEWMGTQIAIIGAGGGLLASIFLGKDVNYLMGTIGLDFLQFGVLVVIIGPVIGLGIIMLFRIFAELARIVAALANNTKEIATSIKEKEKEKLK